MPRTFFLARAEFWAPEQEYPEQNIKNIHVCWSDMIVPTVGQKLEPLGEQHNLRNIANGYPVTVLAVFNEPASRLLQTLMDLASFSSTEGMPRSLLSNEIQPSLYDAINQVVRIATTA